jgi:solute:Na+ symporter, SSS family
MKKILFGFAVFSLLIGMPRVGRADAPELEYFRIQPVESARFEGVAAGRAYAVAGNRIFAIGGRAEDGALLQEIQILERNGSEYTLSRAELPEPLAFAGAVGQGSTVYLVGGLTGEGASDRVRALDWNGRSLTITELPSLPEARILPGVTTHRSTTKEYLYVLGGVGAPDADAAPSTMYELRIEDIKKGRAEWVRKDDLPFGGRVGAVVRETYNEIVVSGGWTVGEGGALSLSAETWGFARVARDGHVHPGWVRRADLPAAVALPAFAKTGQAHLTVMGGAASDSRLADVLDGRIPAEPVDSVWAFHDPTDTWVRIGSIPYPAWSGVLAPGAGDQYVLVDALTPDNEPHPGTLFDFIRATKPMGLIDYLFIALYFIVVAVIGAIFARKQAKQQTSEEFALGNRKVKWWAAGISMFASGVSTISFMALPALIACIGMASSGPAIFMLAGVLVSAFLTYPLLRRLNITSTFEYLERRFGVGLRLVGSFVGIVTQLMGRIGIVVMLPALAISAMTGMDPWKAILLTGIVTTIYSTLGGFEAVIWTDVAQGLLMFVGFSAIGVLAFMNIEGGWATFLEHGRALNRFNFFLVEFDWTIHMMWFAIFGQIIAIMAFASDQSTAQRVLSTPMRDVRKLAFLGGAFGIGIAYIVAAVGMGLFAFFKSNPELLTPVMKNDQIVPLFILHRVPVGLSGIMIAVLFAAAMSTVSTSINSCAVMFGEDFYKRFKKTTTSKSEMRAMQIFSLMAGTVGTGLALWLLSMPMPTLWETFLRIMALLGGGFAGVFGLGMFTRRTHELGAIIGVICSFIVAYFIQYVPWDIHYGGLGLIIVTTCMVPGYLFSLILPWKRKPLKGLTVWDKLTIDEAEARLLVDEPIEG